MADKDKQEDETGTAAAGGADKPDTDKPSGSASHRESTVPGVKRPAHTIDLKADEVKEDKGEGTGSASEPKTQEKAGEKASASATAAKPGEKPPGKTSGKAGPPGGASAASSAARKEPPQRTTPAQVTGFVTHLAAGLVGGVVGLAGAGYLLPHVPGFGVSQEYRQSVDGRIAKLESRLGTIENSVASGSQQQNIEKRAADLEKRLETAERNWDTIKDGPPAMRERLDRLDATLKAMEETAAKGGDVAQTAAVRAQVEAMTGAMDARIATLRGDLDALSQKLSALPATGEANADQASRIEALQRDLESLRARAEAAGSAGGDSAALAIRFTALTRAAENGEPFAPQLDALRAATPENVDLSALDAWAGAGVPTLAELQRRFPAASKAALDAAPRNQGGKSLVDQFLDSASSVVRIRRVDGGGDGGPSAVLSEVGAKLKQGNLRAAVTRAEAEGLPDASRAALGPWLEQARARIALDAALSNVSDELARRLAASGQSR